MKNLNTKLLVFVMLSLMVCGGLKCPPKNDPAPSSPSAPASTASNWTIGTNNYTSSSAARYTAGGNNSLSIYDGSNNSAISIFFSAFPTTSGSYTIVKYNTSGQVSANLAASQISLDAIINNGDDDYLSTGSGSPTAVVAVNSGKITVSLPVFWTRHNNQYGEQPDSLKATGTIVEK